MIDLMGSIFTAYNYVRSDLFVSDCAVLYTKNTDVPDEYFVVMDITRRPTAEIDPLQAELHALLNNFFSLTEGAEKNTNLVLIKNYEYKFDARSQSVINRKISEVEENPYFFKKSLIIFNNEEQSALRKELVSLDSLRIKEALAFVMHDYARFMNFRDYDNDVLFRIISKLYTKLPFLTYSLSPEKQIDLSFEVEKELAKCQLGDKCAELLAVLDYDQASVEEWIISIEGQEGV